ncbi:type IV secretion system DNA-binding domain-containing protein [Xanthomonas nasturtii]|uniref:type IV secretion system DNA-binding domain-containing protein n=1 Tax=Xanthomonas nasturtii TaxID=1843581 RepID=UPI002012BDC3|nr:type IV secretion system DNA-binding domain-containing protein [Xanthomonas nasturtii]MCL1574874.1 type IV secretion system DNA-binding domain-containing protein [Xanthomonas nasturtii]MCL1586494.1 type IV secretion system DNA-binding domain-containing protein [Xanthomonas nasturtii]
MLLLKGLVAVAVSVVFWVVLLKNGVRGVAIVGKAPAVIFRDLYGWLSGGLRLGAIRWLWMVWTLTGIGYVVRSFAMQGLFAGLFALLIACAGSAILASWMTKGAGSSTGPRTVRGASIGQGVPVADSSEYALNVRIGGQVIDHTTEAEHFLISGKTGAGKSQAINAMLRTVRERSDAGLAQRAIIADPAGGYWQKFSRDGDVLLNPFDARSVAWSPFTELREDSDCQNMAKAAIPDVSGDSQQWHFYAQTLFAEVLRALWHRGTWSNKELLRLIMAADRKELAEVVAGTAAAQLTGKESERMLGNTRSIAATYLNAWQQLPDVGTFSVRGWVRESATGPGPWLFLTYRDSQMALMRNLIACWLELAIIEGLELDEDTSGVRRLWYVMDELDSLGKITSLRAGLTKLRKYGGVGVCGLQTIAQLRDRYGREEAQTLLSCLSTKLLLAAGDAETAEYFSREIGDHAVVRNVRSQNSGSSRGMRWDSGSNSHGESLSEQYATERAVLASQITGLANLQGYLKRVNLAEWTPVAIPYVGMPANQPAYVPRPHSGPSPAQTMGEG